MNLSTAENIQSGTKFQKVYSFVINMIEEGLPSYLTYHNVQHTREVLEAVEKLSEFENLSDNDRLLLSTAALFHDTGFVKGSENHEEESCTIAREVLPAYSFTKKKLMKFAASSE